MSCKTTGTTVSRDARHHLDLVQDQLGYISAAYASCPGRPRPAPAPRPRRYSTARQTIITRAEYWFDASNGRISGIAAFGRDIE